MSCKPYIIKQNSDEITELSRLKSICN